MSQKKFTFQEKGHKYFLDDKPLTGVTTILGVINKPALIPWATKMAAEYVRDNCVRDMEGNFIVTPTQLDEAKSAHRAFKEKAADFGTKVHKLIEQYVKLSIEVNGGKPIEDFEISADDADDEKVVRAVTEFVSWAKETVSEFTESEARLYSEEHWYAGTVDLFFKDMDGKLWIADIKTASGVYPEMYAQMGGYDIAYEEMHGAQDVYGYMVIRIDKKKEIIEATAMHDTKICREFFLHALGLYRIINNLKV